MMKNIYNIKMKVEPFIFFSRCLYFLMHLTMMIFMFKYQNIIFFIISLIILILTITKYHKHKIFMIEELLFIFIILILLLSNNYFEKNMKYYESDIIENASLNDLFNETLYQFILDNNFELLEYKDKYECYYLLNNTNYYFVLYSDELPEKPFKVMKYLLDRFIDNSKYKIENVILKDGLFDKKEFKKLFKIKSDIILGLLFLKNVMTMGIYVNGK